VPRKAAAGNGSRWKRKPPQSLGGPLKLHAKADDPLNTMKTSPGIHREHRVIVRIVMRRDVVTHL